MTTQRRRTRRTVAQTDFVVKGGEHDGLRLAVKVMSDGEHIATGAGIFFPDGFPLGTEWDLEAREIRISTT